MSARRSHGQPAQLDALVLEGFQRSALVAVRSLGRAGIAVGAVDADHRAPALASRWCRVAAILPDVAAGQDEHVDALLELLRRHRPRVVIPTHDASVEALRRRRADVEREVALALAPERALSVAVSKPRSIEAANAVGLRSPRGAVVSDASDAGSAMDSVGLPAVVKPARSWVQEGGKGRRFDVGVVTTRKQALAAIASILDGGIDAIVQEWLSGAREAVSFIYGRRRFWARFAQRADRTMPPLGGNSVYRVSIPLPPDILPAAEQLVREVGLDGYTEVEFRRDASGRPAFMEINPRLSASVEVAVRAGVPFPQLLYRLASDDQLEEVAGYRTGVRMRWLGGDLSWLRAVVSNGSDPDAPSPAAAVRQLVADFARPTGYDYVDPTDLRPALAASAGAARRLSRFARARSRPGGGGVGSARPADVDAVVIGAGPYGLSLAAHLTGRGVDHLIFGEPMDTWRNHMPAGMYLKSEGFASNLSDQAGEHTLERFCAETGREYGHLAVPISLDTFANYGLWFQERAVPELDRRLVERVRPDGGAFEVTISGGDAVRARAVVVATGMSGQSYVPKEFERLPASRLIHTFDQRDPGAVPEEGAIVVGAGQSALEGAALIHESGARVQVVSRRPGLAWNSKPGTGDRALLARLRYPESGLGQGQAQWFYGNYPLVFHNGPLGWRREKAFRVLGPAGAWWLRPRIEGRIDVLLGRQVVDAAPDDGGVRVRLRGPNGDEEVSGGVVLAGTGYRPQLGRLEFIDSGLRARIRATDGAPILDRFFESSVPGLFFVGYPAAVEFGPLMRFVFGADFTVRRVSRRLSRS